MFNLVDVGKTTRQSGCEIFFNQHALFQWLNGSSVLKMLLESYSKADGLCSHVHVRVWRMHGVRRLELAVSM